MNLITGNKVLVSTPPVSVLTTQTALTDWQNIFAVPYPEIVSLSISIACNAMSLPGGVAVFNAEFTIDLYCMPLVCSL